MPRTGNHHHYYRDHNDHNPNYEHNMAEHHHHVLDDSDYKYYNDDCPCLVNDDPPITTLNDAIFDALNLDPNICHVDHDEIPDITAQHLFNDLLDVFDDDVASATESYHNNQNNSCGCGREHPNFIPTANTGDFIIDDYVDPIIGL